MNYSSFTFELDGMVIALCERTQMLAREQLRRIVGLSQEDAARAVLLVVIETGIPVAPEQKSESVILADGTIRVV